jgi:hypothetical protein
MVSMLRKRRARILKDSLIVTEGDHFLGSAIQDLLGQGYNVYTMAEDEGGTRFDFYHPGGHHSVILNFASASQA